MLRSPRTFSVVAAAVAAFGVLAAGVSWAQTARGGGSPNAQLVQQLQQLASDRTALQVEAARAKKELEALRQERDALKNAQKAQQQHARSSTAALALANAQRDAAQQELRTNKEKTEQLVAKFRETIQQLREIETDRAGTKQVLATRDSELKVCMDRNQALYKLNDEILSRFEKRSALSRIAAAEPFTGIKRVQLENLIDDYRARADDQHLTPRRLEAAARTAAVPPPGKGVLPESPPGPNRGGAAPAAPAASPERPRAQD
jgi:chromosome segregation ATPase